MEVRLVLLHLAPEAAISHDEQVHFASERGKPVERFGEVELSLVESLWDATGVGDWGIVTDRSAWSDLTILHSGRVVPGLYNHSLPWFSTSHHSR